MIRGGDEKGRNFFSCCFSTERSPEDQEQQEAEEENKYRIDRESKIRNHLDQLATRQRNEHNSLRKKIITGQEELEIKREKEYEMLLHKYNNLKKTIENQQTMETQFFEKSVRTNQKLNRSTLNGFGKVPANGSIKKQY